MEEVNLRMNEVLNIIKSKNVDDVFRDFHGNLLKSVNKFAPLKKASRRELNSKRKPWITNGLVKSINKRNIKTFYKKS